MQEVLPLILAKSFLLSCHLNGWVSPRHPSSSESRAKSEERSRGPRTMCSVCPFALESGGAPRILACKLPRPSVKAEDGQGCCRLQSAASLQPEGSPGTSDLPIPKAGCFALRQCDSSASFLSYFMHRDGHSSQDGWDSYPRKLRANGERPGREGGSRITERGHGSESQRQTSICLS